MTITGPVSGVTPAAGASPPAPVANGAQLEAQLAAQLAAATTPPDLPADPSQAAARAVAAAREQAAERQGALAPLLADLSTALDSPATPPSVRAAIAQVLALRTPATPQLNGPTLQRAVAQSGLMLEARLATAVPASPAPPAANPQIAQAATGRPPPDLKAALLTLQAALKAMPEAAAPARAAPPPAGPGAGMTTQTPPVAAVAAVAATALPAGIGQALDAVSVPATLKAVVAQSLAALSEGGQGARLQAAPTEAATSRSPPAQAQSSQAQSSQVPDAEPPPPQAQASAGPAALTAADRPMLQAAVARVEQLLAAQAAPAPGQSPPLPIQPGQPAGVDLRAALVLLQGLMKDLPNAPARRAAPPPPPTCDGDLAAQAVAIGPELEPQAALERLPAEVDQVLARQALHQLASTHDGGHAPTWMFELPLLTPQGQTVAQFAVSRDGARRGAEENDDKGAWRARFALDIPPLGRVHVHLRMEGDRSSVVLWAEHDETLQRLRADGGLLAGALGGEVVVHPGAPRPAPPAAPGQFVDQRS